MSSSLEERLQKVEEALQTIHERNARVEAQKAWEQSISRIAFIVVLTYVLATLILGLIGNENPFLNALVPTAGYYLSMQSIPFVKRKWIEYRMKKRGT